MTWSKFLDYAEEVITVNVSEAKARLTELIHRAESGERVLISRRNHPMIELRCIETNPIRPRPQFGLCAGEFVVPPDFDSPLSEDVLGLFEGE